MTEIQRNLLIGAIIALLIGGGAYWYFAREAPAAPKDPGYTIEQVDLNPPSLDRSYVITTANVPEDAKRILNEGVAEITAKLRADPNRLDLWLDLAVYYKIAGDFEGASDVWKFVSAVGPTEAQATAFGNLGDLYMNFIKDYPKAEESYRQAINLKPDEISYYRDLHMLYRYLYKTDTTLAADILVEGIEKNPNNEDLLRLQAEYNAAK